MKTRTFCKDLSNVFPNMIRINRGKLSLDSVAEKALKFKTERVIIISNWRESLGKIQLFEINQSGLKVVPPSIYIKDIKLHRDLRFVHTRKKIHSIAIATSKSSFPEINRFEEALSQFLNIPICSFKQIDKGKFDAAIQIYHDPSNCIIITFKLLPKLIEIGPQIKLSHSVWELT